MTSDPRTLFILGYHAEAASAEIERLREEALDARSDARTWHQEADSLQGQVTELTELAAKADAPCSVCSQTSKILHAAIANQPSLALSD